MNGSWAALIGAWNWQPSVLLGCAGLALAYGLMFAGWHPVRIRQASVSTGPERPRVAQALLFFAAVLVLFVVLASPIDELGDEYLFSAHMLQHLLLLAVVPPLLILALPASRMMRLLVRPPIARITRLLARPFMALTIGVGTMWLWHLPALYNAALADEKVHIVEHLCFLVTAVIYWWPVFTPVSEDRLAPLPALVYLFAGMAGNALLGIIITFAPVGWYPIYLHPKDPLGILPLLRDGWRLTPEADQQLAGLLMWIPGNLTFLLAAFGALGTYFAEPDGGEEAEEFGQL